MGYQNKTNKTVWKENLVVFGILGTTVLSGALLTLPSALADDVVDTITITVPTSCSMSSTIATGNEHTAEINNGQYDSAIGETTIKAFCNDNEGFAIYAIGYTDNELGKNVLTNSTLGSTHDIVTGTAITGNTSNWAMKLSTTTSPTPQYPIIIAGSSEDSLKQSGDPDFSNFTNIPDDYKKVAYRTSATDINPEGSSTAEGSTLKTTYQAYISPTQAAGEYTGQVKYTMLHPHTEPAPLSPKTTASGRICYYPNFDAAAENGTMGCQTIPDSGIAYGVSPTSATLLASNFSRDGYGFAGWTNKYDYATNPTQEGIKFYGPQEDITFTAGQYSGSNNGLSLYAVWVKSQGNLQDADKVASVCSGLTAGATNLSSVSALTDQRDNNTYAIAKLADGKCWMIENLRLESDNTTSETDKALAQGYGTSATYGNFGGLADAESTGFRETYTANSLYYSGTQEGTASINIGISNGPAERMPRYNHENTNSRASNPTTNSNAMYSYGNYYTWHAAIADTSYFGGNHDVTSLCPKGWKLPLGNTSTGDIEQGASDSANKVGGFSYLDRKMGGTGAYQSGADASLRWRKYPNNFLYSGYFSGSSAVNRGSYGYGCYWSSTAYSLNTSYELSLGSSYVRPGTETSYKYFGLSIRCVSGS